MAIFRRGAQADDEPNPTQPTVRPPAEIPPERENGPWDESEIDTSDDPAYVDLGALRVRGRVGQQIRLQGDGSETERITAALVVGEDEALELRAFAGPRSGGQWAEVTTDIVAEVERLEGTWEKVDGPFGPEVHLRVPVKTEDGQDAFQPSRIIGIDGPRWMLRATFLGKAALEPRDDGDLMDTFRDVVVVRGDEAMMAREPMLLTPPAAAVAPGDEEAE